MNPIKTAAHRERPTKGLHLVAGLGALLLALAWSLQAVEPAPPDPARTADMPRILANPYDVPFATGPYFVDARDVLTEDGKINRAILLDDDARELERLLARPDNDRGCIAYGRVLACPVDAESRRPNTLAGTLATAQTAIYGRITGRTFGFVGATPGQLLRVETIKVLKGKRVNREHYFFFRVATFTVGSRTICKTDETFGEPPELNEKVLLFTEEAIGKDRNILLVPTAWEIVRVGADDRVAFPEDYVKAEPRLARLPVDAAIREIERAQRQQPVRRRGHSFPTR